MYLTPNYHMLFNIFALFFIATIKLLFLILIWIRVISKWKKIRNLTSNVKYIFLNIRNLKCLLLGLHVAHEHTSKMLKSKNRYIEIINGCRMNFENNRKQYFDVDKNIKGGLVWSLVFDCKYIFTTAKILYTRCIRLSYRLHITLHSIYVIFFEITISIA